MNMIFSYGSLTSKFPKAPSEKAKLECFCELDEYGIYPALIKSTQMNIIFGDMLQLTDKEMEQSDYYEGHPKLYKRVEKSILLDDGSYVMAWVYFFVES